MKHNLLTVFVPFPPQLMSTARTAASMPTQFARDILNMYASEDGAGRKRNGVSKIGNSITGENILRLMYYIPATGSIQILAATDSGKIYLKNGDVWDEKLSGLSTSGTVRWTHFAGKMVICNGVDTLRVWNGITFSEIFEYVVDQSAGLAYVSGTEFTIDGEASLYGVGTKVKARLGSGNYVTSTVASVTGTGTITVTLSDSVLTASLDEVSYESKPPTFSYIYAAHDRLWGFGKGVLTADGFGDDVDRNRIYYTFLTNDETAWHDEVGGLQSINLEDKMPVIDELVAMAVKDGLTIFFFRNYMQIWSGSNPKAIGDFSWNKTIPVGVIHGDLVMEMPNDVGFLTRFGARTLSRTLQTEQLDIGDFGSEVDPSLSQEVSSMMVSDTTYRQAQAFRHDKQGWFGFKPAGKSLVFQVQGASSGWSQYDGIFQDASAFLNTPDGNLYMAVNGQLYIYDEAMWADDITPIATRWWTPWLSFNQVFKRWGNKNVEVITEQGAVIEVTLKRYKNYNSSSFIESTTTALVAADYWEESTWDLSLWDNGAPRPEIIRDKFVSDVFSYAVETNSSDGPLTIFGLKLHGTREK